MVIRASRIKPRPFPLQKVACVYVFERDGLYKVGWSAAPGRRALEVVQANPVKCYEMSATMAPIVEKAAHRALAEFRVRGEWFSAPLPLIDAVIKAAAVERERKRLTA